MSITPSKPVEAGAQSVGQKIRHNIPTTGPARVESDEIEVVDRVPPKSKLEALAFMEEPVTVVVQKSADKFAEAIVTVWNDGRPQSFIRGKPITVKRKFVEALARTRLTTFEEDVHIDRSSHDAVNRLTPSTGLRYPFDVIEDKNPRGRAWLQAVLAEE